MSVGDVIVLVVMADKDPAAMELGKRRWIGVSPEQRSELAKAAVDAREKSARRRVSCKRCGRSIQRRHAIVSSEYESKGKTYRRYVCERCKDERSAEMRRRAQVRKQRMEQSE